MKKRLLSFAAGLVCLSCMASFALAPATVVKIADAELTVAQAAAVSKPGTVTGLKAAPAGKNRVKLTWSAVSGAEGYLVYAQKSGTYGYVGMTTKGTTYTDTKALDSDYNYYFVFAYVKDSNGKMIAGACEKYVYAKGICPAVTYLRATSGADGVKLTWQKVDTADGYLIYGKTDSGAYGYKGMTSNTFWTDTKASEKEYTFYWVFPYHKDASGNMIVGGTASYVYGKKTMYKTYKLGCFTFQAHVKWEVETESDAKTGEYAFIFNDPAGRIAAVHQNVKKSFEESDKDPDDFDFYSEIGVLAALMGMGGYSMDSYTKSTVYGMQFVDFSLSASDSCGKVRFVGYYDTKTYDMYYFMAMTDQYATATQAKTLDAKLTVFFDSIKKV